MPNHDHQSLFVSTWLPIINESIHEILGEVQAAQIIPVPDREHQTLSEIHSRLNDYFGEPVSNGIEQRIGEAGFRIFLSHLGEQSGFFAANYKFLPVRQKFIAGLNLLAGLYRENLDEDAIVLETEQAYQLRLGGNPGITVHQYRGCEFIKGFLREFGSWAGCGKVFQVDDVECREDGFAQCVYNITKVPLE